MSTWYLVRHGETEWNRTGRMQGHTGVPLSAEGRRQATLLAERLRSVEFAAVYCSDLPRAAETARIIAAGRDLAISDEADLREFSYGEWEGLTLAEVETRYPGALAERIEAGGNLGWTAPGGESAIDAIRRVRRFSARASASHERLERTSWSWGTADRCAPLRSACWTWRTPISGSSGSTTPLWPSSADHDGSRVLESWNDTSHLADADSADAS